MTIYLSSRTGAAIDSLLDDVNNSNINKTTLPNTISDLDTIFAAGFYRVDSSAPNNPAGVFGTMVVHGRDSGVTCTQTYIEGSVDKMYFRRLVGSVWQSWQELYHTGNTGTLDFSSASPSPGDEKIRIHLTAGIIRTSRVGTAPAALLEAHNDNGLVGSISTSGTATAYNTSSDPRLKDFKDVPSDALIDAEFGNLFDCFRVFNWKNDPTGDLVWGFDAHECIDRNTNVGSEGEGPRNLELGDVYETTPAVTENRVIMDAEGNPTSEIEEVVITKAIEHKVTPAGVDQSKAVPILLAKIEQLERRLTVAGL